MQFIIESENQRVKYKFPYLNLNEKVLSNFYEVLDSELNFLTSSELNFETLYSWVHVSCINTFSKIMFTPKSPLKFYPLEDIKFQGTCTICLKRGGLFS
jgi:hypothetical protein